jgi:hypothetical protein
MVMVSALKWKIVLRADGPDTPYFSLPPPIGIGKSIGVITPVSDLQ